MLENNDGKKNQVKIAIKIIIGIGTPRNHKRIERIVYLLP